MNIFYAKSTKGFYNTSDHGARTIPIEDPAWVADPDDPDAMPPLVSVDNPDCKIPADAVEISAQYHTELLEAESQGKLIQADQNGYPVAVAPPAPTLADLKTAKNLKINESRLQANLSTFPHAGKVFSCDTLSRSDIDGTANHIALFGTFPPAFPGGWKAADNTVVGMPTIDDFKAFYQSMSAQGTANFNHAQQLKSALAAAQTQAEVDAIVW